MRADGIVLPDDPSERRHDLDSDSGIFSASDAEDTPETEEDADVSASWPEIHAAVTDTISELGGRVVPKLTWSAPKDATWISATNSMECRTPNDIYLLLKSSDFVTHDLEHAFDGCDDTDDHESPTKVTDDHDTTRIDHHLVLRKHFQLNPSLEFRCFVRNRKLLAICQRDLNHFEFLFTLRPRLIERITDLFTTHVQNTFPEDDFVFDVYIPPPHDRVWIIDFNPWDQRTDPLLFSWLELLTMDEPEESDHTEDELVGQVVRLKLADHAVDSSSPEQLPSTSATLHDASDPTSLHTSDNNTQNINEVDDDDDTDSNSSVSSTASEINYHPRGIELRLVNRDDPEAYMFNSARYSAHKMPRDVVDASQSGAGGLREFAATWEDVLAKRQVADAESDADSSDDETVGHA